MLWVINDSVRSPLRRSPGAESLGRPLDSIGEHLDKGINIGSNAASGVDPACRGAKSGAGQVGGLLCLSGARAMRPVDAAKEGHLCAHAGPCATVHDNREHG